MSGFDGRESERLKTEGMALAARNRDEILAYARMVAQQLARREPDRCITIDHVGRVMKRLGVDSLGGAAGLLFKTEDWVWTGRFVKSHRITNHSRLVRVWQLKDGR